MSRLGGKDGVPSEPPRVVSAREQDGFRVLRVCGEDGRGEEYRTDFVVGMEDGEITLRTSRLLDRGDLLRRTWRRRSGHGRPGGGLTVCRRRGGGLPARPGPRWALRYPAWVPRRQRRRRTGTLAPDDQGSAPQYLDQADAPEGVAVRPIQPYQAVKRYRCPGCDHEILPGTAHLVVVPDDTPEDRRHWHTSCWRRHLRSGGRRSS